ncbi:hypothetical protein [Saccharothrix coeruleofusca]|nr:hypothetical protein [Saccharothrix coeruleofusca]
MLSDEVTGQVVAWVAAGGPGGVAVPAELASNVLDPAKREDEDLDGEPAS